MDLHVLAGGASLAVGVVGYALYITSIVKRRIVPHAFSWGVWGLMATVMFFGQRVAGAGPGSWVVGLAALACGVIFLLSLRWGEKRITRLDIGMLGLGLLALALWAMTRDPLLAVLLAGLANVIGGNGPTIRKAYDDPASESALYFALTTLKYAFALVALSSWNFTALFPILINGFGDFAVVLVILTQRARKLPVLEQKTP